MDQFRLIDDKTYRSTRMTPQEAQAVIEMWSLQHRMSEEAGGMTTIDDVAEGLTISPTEVRQYLRQVRNHGKRVRPPRSKATDVKLALAAMATVVIVVASIAGAMNARRPYYPYYSSPINVTATGNGLTAYDYRYSTPPDWESQYTQGPNRFAISIGSTIFTCSPNRPIQATPEQLKSVIRSCVGGALGDESIVASEPITKADIDAALASDPLRSEGSTSDGPRVETYSSRESRSRNAELVDWQQLKLAYGGKVARGWIPYAKISEPSLREAVRKVQDDRIAKLAEAGMDLAKAK